MSAESEFFLGSKSYIVQLDCLEISHSSFSQTYYIVRNATNGVTVTHEDSTVHDYEYYPLAIKGIGDRENMDFGLEITLGDLGELIPMELDRVRADGKFSEKPVVYYRTYRSDLLSSPMYGPVKMEIKEIPRNREGASFTAKAPSLNINQTGEIYTIDRFPMLRGFL